MATFFDDLGESLNKYPKILTVLKANKDSLERFCGSLKESKLMTRSCDRSSSQVEAILNSIVPCIEYHEDKEEEACLNFLSSLRKASPDLVSTAISLREEWHQLAHRRGYPDNFLKAETCELSIVIGFCTPCDHV